jgi:hypothetical protein
VLIHECQATLGIGILGWIWELFALAVVLGFFQQFPGTRGDVMAENVDNHLIGSLPFIFGLVLLITYFSNLQPVFF